MKKVSRRFTTRESFKSVADILAFSYNVSTDRTNNRRNRLLSIEELMKILSVGYSGDTPIARYLEIL